MGWDYIGGLSMNIMQSPVLFLFWRSFSSKMVDLCGSSPCDNRPQDLLTDDFVYVRKNSEISLISQLFDEFLDER